MQNRVQGFRISVYMISKTSAFNLKKVGLFNLPNNTLIALSKNKLTFDTLSYAFQGIYFVTLLSLA